VAGRWVQSGPTTIRYDLAAPLIPSSTEHVAVPGGSSGVRGKNGSLLPAAGASFTFTVADGDTLRLQELLAELDYLPLTFTSSGPLPAARDAATPQYGSFAWRWPGLPVNLTSLWTQGVESVITKAAVMTFENQNGLTVDGLAGPVVWSTLLQDVAANKVDSSPYTYVLVSKVLPENLTLYNDGAPQFTNILVNTGAPGADTVDGTYPVFEHVTASVMKGTNPDGTTYDDPNVPWASFFNGGDALHGFVRAQYGFPQSNGCVEMTVANAGTLWPYTPIGTLVTVVGPAS
jgi:peptidoglycan hydrolase-like protein with peptidoglycan-binding domain